MYIVKIINDGVEIEIHNDVEKLTSGSVVKGINTIDSFSFTIPPTNIGFNLLKDLKTLVTVYNTNKERYEFDGRVLYTDVEMDDSGKISKSVTCENLLGFLHDSQQAYYGEYNQQAYAMWFAILSRHNEYMEDYKKFTVGKFEATATSTNMSGSIDQGTTFEAIQKRFIDALGGEIQAYRDEITGMIVIDYLKQIGTAKDTKIELSRNMKAITRERDPSELITRLIPLGAKVSDSSEGRIGIYGVEGNWDYIDDEAAIAEYGVRVGYQIWDDVHSPTELLTKAKAWMKANSRVPVKYSITALDLSLLGLDVDDFEVGNTHPIVNPLLGIEDTARIIKKTINICDDTKSAIEVGDKFKTLSEIQRDQKREKVTYSTSEIVSEVINALPNGDGEDY